MRKIYYWLSLVLLISATLVACVQRTGQSSLIPVHEDDLLPATYSLQKLPDW